MRHNDMLVAASLLAILLMTLHFAQDALQAKAGTQAAGAGNLTAIAILVVWLAGTLLLADRRWGLVIMLLGGAFAAGMPVLHFSGVDLTKRREALLFVWGLVALGVSGAFSVVLATLALLRDRRGARPEGA